MDANLRTRTDCACGSWQPTTHCGRRLDVARAQPFLTTYLTADLSDRVSRGFGGTRGKTRHLYGNLFDNAGQDMATKAAGIVPRHRRSPDETLIPDKSPTTGPAVVRS